MDKKVLKKAERIDKLLAEVYGEKKYEAKTDPLTELVLTVLSQNTNDTNRDRAFEALKAKYPTWEKLANADKKALAETIKVGGLANTKSGRILKMIRSIKKERNNLNLDFLNEMPDNEVQEYLLKIDGVGPKTVACVLAFAMGRDVMPVDTHVHRVSSRLELIPPKMTAEKAHEYFLQFKGIVSLYQFHLNLIAHGRMLCKARNPLCEKCNLKRLCGYYADNVKNKGQAA